MNEQTILKSLSILFSELSPARRRSIVSLMALMIVGAFAELFSLGAIVVFLSTISSPTKMPGYSALASAFPLLAEVSTNQIVWASTVIFAITVLAAAVLRLALQRQTLKFVYGFSYDLSVRLFRICLYRDYTYHTRHNSSETLAAVNKAQQVTSELILPLMQACVSLVLAISIICGLMWINPIVAMVSGGALATIYLVTSRLCHSRLRRNGQIASSAQARRVRVIQEGLGGIRDILLDRSQSVFIEDYDRAESELLDARVSTAVMAQAPRFIVEGLGMVVVAVVACVATLQSGGINTALPTLGALALGAQRLLPLLQIIYAAGATSAGSLQLLFDLVELLKRDDAPFPEEGAQISFRRELEIDGVSFRYTESGRPALSDVSLRILRGQRIGIAGKTGSGKSTLMDIIIGLIHPTEGQIKVDGVPLTAANCHAWQRHIAHVPQSIFLSDASIAENIALGVRRSDIDMERVRRVAEQAELTDVIAALPQGYDTRVGERGVKLSGGQRQRIGIARALYKKAVILVFDEATSALDNATEAAVMSSIERLERNLTVLIIAHRLSTLDGCDHIVWLESGRVVQPAGEGELTESLTARSCGT